MKVPIKASETPWLRVTNCLAEVVETHTQHWRHSQLKYRPLSAPNCHPSRTNKFG